MMIKGRCKQLLTTLKMNDVYKNGNDFGTNYSTLKTDLLI